MAVRWTKELADEYITDFAIMSRDEMSLKYGLRKLKIGEKYSSLRKQFYGVEKQAQHKYSQFEKNFIVAHYMVKLEPMQCAEMLGLPYTNFRTRIQSMRNRGLDIATKFLPIGTVRKHKKHGLIVLRVKTIDGWMYAGPEKKITESDTTYTQRKQDKEPLLVLNESVGCNSVEMVSKKVNNIRAKLNPVPRINRDRPSKKRKTKKMPPNEPKYSISIQVATRIAEKHKKLESEKLKTRLVTQPMKSVRLDSKTIIQVPQDMIITEQFIQQKRTQYNIK